LLNLPKAKHRFSRSNKGLRQLDSFIKIGDSMPQIDKQEALTLWFNEVGKQDLGLVGGKGC